MGWGFVDAQERASLRGGRIWVDDLLRSQSSRRGGDSDGEYDIYLRSYFGLFANAACFLFVDFVSSRAEGTFFRRVSFVNHQFEDCLLTFVPLLSLSSAQTKYEKVGPDPGGSTSTELGRGKERGTTTRFDHDTSRDERKKRRKGELGS